MVFKSLTLICSCGNRFRARDKQGNVRTGSATVKRLIADGVEQHCPNCQKVWQPTKVICGSCHTGIRARDEQGNLVPIKLLIAAGIEIACPKCGQVWQPPQAQPLVPA